jgi:hypothetical protein
MNAELIATKQFEASIAELLTVDGVAALEYAIAVAPSAHPVIPGTGGARKMRWARKGMGKRGGIRVIYFYAARYETVLLMVAYAKNTQENLTNDQKKAVRKLTEGFEKELEAERGPQA